MWTHDQEIELSYLRLISRSGGLTLAMREKKDALEQQFLALGFGPFPGGVEYIRYQREQREKEADKADMYSDQFKAAAKNSSPESRCTKPNLDLFD